MKFLKNGVIGNLPGAPAIRTAITDPCPSLTSSFWLRECPFEIAWLPLSLRIPPRPQCFKLAPEMTFHRCWHTICTLSFRDSPQCPLQIGVILPNVTDQRKSVSGKTFSRQVILVQLFRTSGIHSSTLAFRSVRLSLASGLITDMTLSL
jgi:hypothetical protein